LALAAGEDILGLIVGLVVGVIVLGDILGIYIIEKVNFRNLV
jgi:hypothetical protein